MTAECPKELQVIAMAKKMNLSIGACPLKEYCHGQNCYLLSQVQEQAEKKGEETQKKIHQKSPPIRRNFPY